MEEEQEQLRQKYDAAITAAKEPEAQAVLEVQKRDVDFADRVLRQVASDESVPVSNKGLPARRLRSPQVPVEGVLTYPAHSVCRPRFDRIRHTPCAACDLIVSGTLRGGRYNEQ